MHTRYQSCPVSTSLLYFFFFQAEDGIRDLTVTGVQTCALPISLYRCQDKLLAHKAALFSFLRERWQELFHAEFEVLLYDLTSTYFECDPPTSGKRRFGYSRDKRPD